ncbi:hypothetical protein ACLK19_03745 [Escherichia coli]
MRTDTRTEDDQLLFVDFHLSFHGQKRERKRQEAKKLGFQHLSFPFLLGEDYANKNIKL